jgi:pimeloyl-ACP methyl ester carboxylesterase
VPELRDPSAPATATEPFTSRSDAKVRPVLVVLVHGIGGSAKTWATLLSLCTHDARLAHFTFKTFEYATGLGRLNPTKQLPTIETAAAQLRGFLGGSQCAGYRDLRLVGHSQGGLVIQRYLEQMLTEGRGRELDRLRHVIFFATPTLGSTIGSPLRNLLFRFVSNPQEKELRAYNETVGKTRKYIEQHVSETADRTANTAPLPIHVFYGAEDHIVDPESAMASFSSSFPIPGGHSGLINPTSDSDPRYTAFADMLLTPIGHRHVFEIARSEYALRLEPADPTKPFKAPLPGGRTRNVESTCVGHYSRRVRFAETNRCEDLFEMRYKTQEDGYIQAKVIPKNQCSDVIQREYEQRGTNFRYHFKPVQRVADEYAMYLGIHGGFDAGNRNVHFHLTRVGDRWARLHEWAFELDLRPMLAAGWSMRQQPTLYLLDVDLNHEQCPTVDDQRLSPGALGAELAPLAGSESGVWRWALYNVERGIVNCLWDVDHA